MKRQDFVNFILSTPNNIHNKTALKKMKKETIEVLYKSLQNQSTPSQSAISEEKVIEPKKTFTRKDRKLIEFSDDEKDDDIEIKPVEEIKPVQVEVTPQPVQVEVTPQPVQLEVTPQPVRVVIPESTVKQQEPIKKSKPVLTGRKKEIKPEPVKIKKPTLDDLKDEIKELIAEFANLMIDDIKAYKQGEISDDELIDSHNNLRHEVEDNVAIMCSTVKRTDSFDDWVERLLDIVRNKVERIL